MSVRKEVIALTLAGASSYVCGIVLVNGTFFRSMDTGRQVPCVFSCFFKVSVVFEQLTVNITGAGSVCIHFNDQRGKKGGCMRDHTRNFRDSEWHYMCTQRPSLL